MIIQNYGEYGRHCYRISPTSKRNIGYFTLYDHRDRAEIWSLYIIQSKRNKGYGKRMLSEFLQEYNGNKPLFLYVEKDNEIALRLYKKVGFVIVGDHHGYAWKMQYMPCSN